MANTQEELDQERLRKEQEQKMRDQQREQLEAEASAPTFQTIDAGPEIPPATAIPDAPEGRPQTWDQVSPEVRQQYMREQQRQAVDADIAASQALPGVSDFVGRQETVPPAPSLDVQPEDPARAEMIEARRSESGAFADYLQGLKDDYDREQEEINQQVAEEKRAARWAGATELAASIANLVGVGGANAVSQQYKPVSQDWMQKADRDLREGRNRLRDARQRQRDIELRLAQMRSQNGLALAQYDAQQRQQQIQNAMAARKAELDAQFKAGEIGIKQYEAETKRAQAEAAAALNAAKAKNDEIRAKAAAARDYSTATVNKEKATQIRTGGGSKSTSDLTITFDSTDERDGVKVQIKDQSLLRTVQANLDVLPEADRKKAEAILNDPDLKSADKADRLVQYIKRSPKMVDLIENSATSSEPYGKKKQSEDQASGTSGKRGELDEDGFLI